MVLYIAQLWTFQLVNISYAQEKKTLTKAFSHLLPSTLAEKDIMSYYIIKCVLISIFSHLTYVRLFDTCLF